MNKIDQIQKNVALSIERLASLLKIQDESRVLAAFAYTGTLLDKYLEKEDDHNKAKYYYESFQRQVSSFNCQNNFRGQFKIKSRNRIEIMQQIKEILQKHRHIKDGVGWQIQMEKAIKQKDTRYFNQHLQKIKLLYEEHNIDQVMREINSLRAMAQTNKNIKQLLLAYNVANQFTRYEQQYQNMISFYGIFQQSDGWIFDKQQDNIKVQYKVFEEQRTIAVRIDGQIQIQMLPFMAIVCQIDLTKYCVPFVEISEEKKDNFKEKPPRNLKIGFTLTSVPLLADRECYYYAYGYDRMKTTGSIFILSKSFQDDRKFQQKYNYVINHQGKIFLKVYYFCLQYQPISNTRAKIRIASKVNFKLTFLPLFILRLSARKFAFDYLENLVEKSKKYKGSKWQEKVKSNPSMYDFFQSKIDQYFG